MHAHSQEVDLAELRGSSAQGNTHMAGLLIVEEAAGMLRVPVSWLRHRVANRQVSCTRLGRHIRFTREQVAAIVDGSVQPQVEEPFTGLTRRARRPR